MNGVDVSGIAAEQVLEWLITLKAQDRVLIALLSRLISELGAGEWAESVTDAYALEAGAWFAFVGFWQAYHRPTYPIDYTDLSDYV